MSMFTHNVFDSVRTRVIVVHEQQMLLLSPNKPEAGWRLPGGGLEKDESLFECGEREVLEETGLVVRVNSVAFLREWIVPKYCLMPGEAGVGYGLEVHLYAVPVSIGELRTEAGTSEVPHWIAFDQVGSMPVWPKELKTLAAWLAAGNKPRGVPAFVADMESPDAPAPQVDFHL